MKTLALLLLLAGASTAFADTDLLQNGDFADGISHWEGDCHSVGSASDDSSATTGVVIKLRDGDWTKISQDFDGKVGNYTLTVTYTVTPDIKFSLRPEDYKSTTLKMGLIGLVAASTTPGEWCVVVVDSGIHMYDYWQVSPKLDPNGVQKIMLKVDLGSGADHKKGFYLGFPPGSGSINLQSITLVPFGSSTAAN